MYMIKQSIFMLMSKCAGMGAIKNFKNAHLRWVCVQDEKLLCTECAGVPKMTAHKYSVKNVLK